MFDTIVKVIAIAGAVIAYLAYVLFHPRYSHDELDRLQVTRLTAGNVTWAVLLVAGAALAFVLRSEGLVPAGLIAIAFGYLDFRYGASSMMADALEKPTFFLSGRRTTAWLLFSVIVVLLGLVALLVERIIYAPVAAVGLVIIHLAANAVSGISAGNREVLLVQTIVQSYAAARGRLGSAPEGDVLTMTLDLAAERMTKRTQAGNFMDMRYHIDSLKQEVATGKILDITNLAELALAIVYPLGDWGDGMNGFYRQMAEHERRGKLVASCLDAAAIPERLRGKKAQSPSPENESS